jgi:hypothetical protein
MITSAPRFVFQHGSQPDDYLLAHVLAMTARAVEPPCGIWIGAATLDRYLHSIGKAQVFGTTSVMRCWCSLAMMPISRLPQMARPAR